MNKFSVSVLSEDPSKELTVLKIASASRNTSTQLYPDRVQISRIQLEDLHKKLIHKLGLHHINEVDVDIDLHFQNDRIQTFCTLQDFLNYDLKISLLTESVTFKWSFVFDSTGTGNPHLHSVYIKFAQMPNPGVLLQRLLSSRSEDGDKIEADLFSPTVCKLDFADSRFANELFSVVKDWLKGQPRVEPAFGFVFKLLEYSDGIKRFIESTLPTIAVLAYVGIWLGFLPDSISTSTKYAVAWMLGGAAVFFMSRYCATGLGRFLDKCIRRMSLAPVFQLTSGDGNRLTKFLAKSQKSAITLAATGLIYGLSQGLGLFLASKILTHFK